MGLFEKLIGKKQNDESIEKVDENHCLIHPEKEKFAVCHRCHKSFCYDCLIRGVYGDYLCRDCSARSISAGRFGWDYTKKEMIQLLPSDLSYHETLVLEVMCRDCQKEALKELKKQKVPPEMKLERIQ